VTTLNLADRARRRIGLQRRLGSGIARVRLSWWAIGQSALGGASAWEIDVRLLGHSAPYFASVAAIVCLSISVVNRMRRVLELALGVTIGVLLGDLLVHQIGRGGWQLGLVVLIAMTIALMFDGGVLIVNQAALQAVFVTALPPPAGGYLGRWQDALLGSGVALAIAFLLPADPRRAMRRNVAEVAHTIADALRLSAAASRAGDPEAAFLALEQARATQPMLQRWTDAVSAGEEISRLSPLRRHADAEIAAHRRSLDPVDHAVRNLRVALRRIDTAVEDSALSGEPLTIPATVLDRIDDLSGAVHTLPGALRDPDGEGGRRAIAALTGLVAGLDPQQPAAGSMSATVVLAQLRSAVVDLLQVPGLSQDEARAILRLGGRPT
jgi:uncharacterized membrane protein YgaE (UPF0421/DUF939 family)